jgi:hypothetical protein
LTAIWRPAHDCQANPVSVYVSRQTPSSGFRQAVLADGIS